MVRFYDSILLQIVLMCVSARLCVCVCIVWLYVVTLIGIMCEMYCQGMDTLVVNVNVLLLFWFVTELPCLFWCVEGIFSFLNEHYLRGGPEALP
jgi:hypothetical protein